ncbi:MAG: hypothetical protein GC199_09795 [Alphaproteobacteria bacterium]|nr:hypothetical protein [Alphaproteobacteria bacterium]
MAGFNSEPTTQDWVGTMPRASDLEVHEGRDPDRELRSLQTRFRAIREADERRRRWARLSVRLLPVAVLGMTVFAVSAALFLLSPYSPWDTVRHMLAAPNCDMARLVGLAPSRDGEAGYWSRNDADADGVACEPVPYDRRVFLR